MPKIRFVEPVRVLDHNRDEVERYAAGEVADLPPDSARRWERRRKAVFVPEDTEVGLPAARGRLDTLAEAKRQLEEQDAAEDKASARSKPKSGGQKTQKTGGAGAGGAAAKSAS